MVLLILINGLKAMNNSLLFSIIIPCYNGEAFINRCLNSLLSQTYKNWEAIIVNNYSEDNTLLKVSEYNDDRIKIYNFHNNGIIAASRNFGISKSNGDWVCFLDVDDWWTQSKLEFIFPYTEKYDFIYHDLKYHYDNSITHITNVLRGRKVKGPSKVSYLLSKGNPIATSSVCISKSVSEFYFSESPSLVGVEDFDLWISLFNRGIKAIYIHKCLGYYFMGMTCSKSFKQMYQYRNLLKKWITFLTKEQKKEAILIYYFQSAQLYFVHGLYKKAHNLWLKSLFSHDFHVKINSIKGLIKIFLKR